MTDERYKLRDIIKDEAQLMRFVQFMDPKNAMSGSAVPSDLLAAAFGEPQRSQGIANLKVYHRQFWLVEPVRVSETPSPDGHWFASVDGGNIMLRAAGDGGLIQLTRDGTTDFSWDIEAPRIKSAAGIGQIQHLLCPWSPNGKQLFAIQYDRREVPDLHFIRYHKEDQKIGSLKMQRAGAPIDVAYPHIIDVPSGMARRLCLGDTRDHYFTLVGWLPDGSEVLFTRHSRDFKNVDVLAANAVTGVTRVVLSESASTFVALQHEVLFGGDNHITLMPDGSGFIWRSSRSGWNHFYWYALDGRLLGQVTRGEFPVIAAIAIDQGWLYFTAHHDQSRPYDTHLCRVPVTGGEIHRLTPRDGQNVVALSPAKKAFVIVNSRPDRQYAADFHHLDGEHAAALQTSSLSAFETSARVVSEEFKVTAADGQTPLWGVMHKPADFNPNRKYPVIDHIYAGPQVSFVNRHFGFHNDNQRLERALTQLGYIVISVDARGTPERSKAFQDVVYRNWGRHEIPDHAATIRQLAQRHDYIDLNRVGVWGHSWGGHFAIRALAQAPEIFQVGVASAPGVDPHDLILYEPYLGLPAQAKEVYDHASLYPLVEKIIGKLLIVVGTSDHATYASVLKMVHRLIHAEVEHELVILPGGTHELVGKDKDYFVHKLVKHFEVHLKSRG